MSDAQKKIAAKRARIFLPEDLLLHRSPGDCWVSRDGKVYNVSNFVADHPGGDDLILQHAGQDMRSIMEDPDQHTHSKAAYDVLSEFQIGVIGTPESIVNPDLIIDDNFKPTSTDVEADYVKNSFLNLNEPLIMQMWNSNFSKSFYLQQVHQPRHMNEPATLFSSWYLEMFTRTPWYMVPLLWVPITATIFQKSVQQHVENGLNIQAALGMTMVCFLVGNVVWTVLEYSMHRFLFHIDGYLPDRPCFLLLHFLLHGIHHFLPMDRLRLVMPPLLFTVLQFPFTQLAYKVFPVAIANGIIAGAFAFYVLYDCMHYALHHTKLPQYIKSMKVYHMAHHFKNSDLGFGVTSKMWDYVFGTVLPV